MPQPSVSQSAEQIAAEKPFDHIIQNLENAFGTPQLPPKSDPLAMLVKIVLSQATTNANSNRTFANLKKRFGNWEELLTADEKEIAAAIRLGGLADQKAKVIKNLFHRIKEKHRSLSLEFVEKMSAKDAKEFLQSFRGVGPKTAACTLLFASHKKVFPLDTHIFRIFRRMGVLPERISDKKAHALLDEIVPEGKFYSLHVNLIALGRKICRPREPKCEICPLVEYCDLGLTKI